MWRIFQEDENCMSFITGRHEIYRNNHIFKENASEMVKSPIADICTDCSRNYNIPKIIFTQAVENVQNMF